MKNYTPLLYLFIVISLINTALIVFYFRSETESVQTSIYIPEDTKIEHSMTTDIVLPEEMEFAGEKVPLHRLDIQEALRKELIVNTYLHSHTIQTLKTAPRVFAIIEPILKEAGIPDDFKYLAVIESNLNPSAVSPAGATGIWQFMEGTGKEFGLEINPEVDERYHIEKSTRAATRYLRKGFDRFSSWTTTAASYNAGMSMVSRQSDLQKEQNYYSLLLGDETERYVFRILALKQIMNNPTLYNFLVTTVYPVEETKNIKVNTPVKDWALFAREHDISYKTLKRFNPWLRKNDLKNPYRKTYEIRIPEDEKNYK